MLKGARSEREGIISSWQIERWARLCKLAAEETDKNKFSGEISEAYNV
jgi:hypothetical protein